MTAPDVLAAFVAQAERIYPDRRPAPPPPEFVMLAPPEPCEVCGTAVFPARWKGAPVALWHIGWEYQRERAHLLRHRPELCQKARRNGIRLDGRKLRFVPDGSQGGEHR